MGARTRRPRARYQMKHVRRLVLVSLACILLSMAAGGCTSDSGAPTATPYFGAELDGPPPNQSIIQTAEARSDYRKDLTLREAAMLLKWEPLIPDPEKYQLTTGLVDVISYPGEGEVLIARYSTPVGVDFELRQAHHTFRSIPNKPTDYVHQDVAGFLLDGWADQYQSFAEVRSNQLPEWRGFVIAYTQNLGALGEFVSSLQ